MNAVSAVMPKAPAANNGRLICVEACAAVAEATHLADPFSTGSATPPATCPFSSKQTIYSKLGGRDAVQAAVDIFYSKLLADDRVKHFFQGIDMKAQRAKQLSFMCYAFGGPNSWKGKSMYEAHKHLNLNDHHFTAVAEAFIATLQELSVPQELIDEAVAVVAAAKPQVLGQGS